MDVTVNNSPRRSRSPSRSRSPVVRHSRSGSRSRSRSPVARRSFDRSPRGRSRSRSPSRDRYSRDRRGHGDRYDRYEPRDRVRREPRPVNRGSEEERATSKTLYIGNLPFSYQEREVEDMMVKFGPIRQISLPREGFNRRPRGFCFVEFEERSHAEEAMAKCQGLLLDGRTLRLDWDAGRDRKEQRPRDEYRPRDTYRRDDFRRDDRDRDYYRRDDRPRDDRPRDDIRRDDRPRDDFRREDRGRDEYRPRTSYARGAEY